MRDEEKTKEQLINELAELRRRVSQSEEAEVEHKHIAEALKESDAELSAIMDSAPLAMILVDEECRVRKVNGAMVKFTGCVAEEMIGLRGGEVIRCLNQFDDPRGCGFGPSCQTCDVRRAVLDTFETGNPHNQVEAVLPFASGEGKEERHLLISTALISSVNRRGVLVCIEDITEFKRTEEKYRHLLEDMSDGYCMVQEGRFVFANKRFDEIYGYDHGEMIGKRLVDLSIPENYQAALQRYEGVMRGEIGLSKGRESSGLRKNGTVVITEVTSNIMQYEGKPALCMAVRDITERKLTEEKYRQLLEDMSDGYVVIQNGKYVFANGRYGEIFGYDPEKIVGLSILDLAPLGERQKVKERYEEVTRGEQEPVDIYEGSAVKLDGTEIVVEASTKAILYDGKPAFATIIRDVTERKKMEEKLWESRHRFRALMENTKLGVSIIDADHKVIETNKTFTDLFGKTPEYFVGKYCFEEFEKRPAICPHCPGVLAMASGNTEEIDTQGVRDDGSRFDVHLHAVPLFSQKGRVEGFIEIVEDTTERNRMQRIIQESEEKLRLIFESVPEGIIVTDLKGGILSVNEGTVHMHGYDSKEELIGRSCFDLVAEREHVRMIDSMQVVQETGSTRVIIYTLVKKDGSEFPATASATALKDAIGQPVGFVAVTADITEQQKIQGQLMLTDRLISIGQLASGIAHEVNNPLAAVIGISNLLLEEDVPDAIRGDLKTIDEEANRAARIVKGLLTFAQSKETEKALEDINSIIQDVLQLRSCEQSSVDIEVDEQFASDLSWVNVNGAQMRQVFMNLIVNAEQAMLEAHGKGRLKITTERVEDMIRVTVADDGPGISLENMRKIFTPFFTTKEVGQGTGLGLSICHGIVTEHGGRIYAESKPGEGASFIVELPVPTSRGVKIVDNNRITQIRS